MDIEVVYGPRQQSQKKIPKTRERRFSGVKIKDRWGNEYNLYPFFAKSREALQQEMNGLGYEIVDFGAETAP